MVIVEAKERVAVWDSWWDRVSGYKWEMTLANASDLKKGGSTMDKRYKDDGGVGADYDDKSMILMGLTWDMAFKDYYDRWNWWILHSVKMNVDEWVMP